MALFQDDAVVLTRLDYSETSQVLVLFTRRHGKVRAIAKGIKRGTRNRFAVGIDLLETGTVVFNARSDRAESLATLTEWKQVRVNTGLREQLQRLYAAQYAAEITAHLTEDWDPHEAVYEAITQTFDALSRPCEPIGILVELQWRLLDAIGLWPRFDACMLCGRVADLTHFSSFEGGMICRHCEPGQVEKWELSPRVPVLLKAVSAGPVAALGSADHSTSDRSADRSTVQAAFSVLDYHIAHQMGRQPVLSRLLVPGATRRRVK